MILECRVLLLKLFSLESTSEMSDGFFHTKSVMQIQQSSKSRRNIPFISGARHRSMRIKKSTVLLQLLILTLFALCIYKFLTRQDETPGVKDAVLTAQSQFSIQSNSSVAVKYYYSSCDYHVIFNQDEVNGICAPHPPDTSVCRVVRVDHLNQRDFRSARLTLPDNRALTVFVHPPKDLISNSIVQTGGWDAGGVDTILRALTALPGATLVDIGCNLGVFSLRAASDLGRRVVAIDANYQNVIRLRKSVLSNGLQDRVQVFWNALATDHGVLRMRLPTDCNIGGGMPTEVLQSHWLRDPVEVQSAGLDQVLKDSGILQNVTDIVIKMDIEGGEWGAIATAVETFSHSRVPVVLMEWRGTQIFHPDKGDFLLQFFSTRNYTAYNFWGSRPVALNNADQKTWPGDVLWVNHRGVKLLSRLK